MSQDWVTDGWGDDDSRMGGDGGWGDDDSRMGGDGGWGTTTQGRTPAASPGRARRAGLAGLPS